MTKHAETEVLRHWDDQGEWWPNVRSSSPRSSRQAKTHHGLLEPWDEPQQDVVVDSYFDLDEEALSIEDGDAAFDIEQLESADESLSVAPVSVASRLTGPIQLLNKILETWRLDKADAVSLLGLEPSDQGYAADVLAGRTALRGRDAKDRLAYLIQIRMALSAWFRDEQAENEWLREPQEPLDGEVPMSLLLKGSMGNLLLVKEYIEAATGW